MAQLETPPRSPLETTATTVKDDGEDGPCVTPSCIIDMINGHTGHGAKPDIRGLSRNRKTGLVGTDTDYWGVCVCVLFIYCPPKRGT